MRDATKLERGLSLLKDFQADVAHTFLGQKSEDTQFLIKHLVEEILQEVIQRSPMSRVSPAELYRREEEIIMAHDGTFQWVFGDESSPMRHSHPHLHFDHFVDWLRCGNGIFHITGKPGSGKSTLMKFLSQHRRTQQELIN
jgi:Cdc6-like AAA superfamily ATPase